MFRISIPLIALLVTASFSSAYATSFDCTKVATQSEKLICEDKELSASDNALNSVLQSDMDPLSDAGKASMLKGQAAWHVFVDAICSRTSVIPDPNPAAPFIACLKDEYKKRQKQLSNATVKTDDFLFRRVDIFEALKAPDVNSPHPGAIMIQIAYPQIDAPSNANEEAWNQYIEQQAAGLRHAEGNPVATDVAIEYEVQPVNSDAISTTMVLYYYPHGAAHGNGGSAIYTWLLKDKRTVKPEDVFDATKNWKPALQKICFDSLMTRNTAGHQVFDINGPDKLEPIVGDTTRWSFTADGLGIQFNYYEVGPRTAGMPKVIIPWPQLKPYLGDRSSDLIPD